MIRNSFGGASHVDRSSYSGGNFKSYLTFLFMALCAIMLPNWAAAAAPPAGAVIGNQATASYTDAGGNTRSTTSNLVNTTITQVAGVDVKDDQTKTSTAGSLVYLPHTVTNTGNGTDSYNLTATQVSGGGFDFTPGSIKIFADDNGDGVPDDPNTPVTTTGTMTAGQTKNYVVAVTVPATATSGQQSQVTIKAVSQFTNTVTDSNTDTVKITTNAVVPVTKSLSVQSGPAGSTVVITLTYTNNGNNTASNLTLIDNLDSKYQYQAGTGLWSVSGATALTDPAGGDPAGIDYSVTGQQVKAVIASVAPGQSGFVKFTVKVAAGTGPGTIPNTADETYNDGSGTTVTDHSNPSPFTVTPVVNVKLSDTNSTNDTDGSQNDVVTRPAAPQGATVDFDNVVQNTGNGNDTFNVTVDSSTVGQPGGFPAGTSFLLLNAAGVPMVDSNGDGIQDTGVLAPGAEFHVILRALLPSNGAAPGAGPFNVVKKATSVADPSKFDTVTDRLTSITANTVDLTNNSAGPAAPGAGVGPEAAPVTVNPVDPGKSTSFVLFVNNTSGVADTYNLTAGKDSAMNPMPAGWSVVFHDGDASGAVISSIAVAAGGNKKVTAVVTVPAAQAPGTQDVFFRAVSPTSGALDVKHDAVSVNQVIDVAIMPDNVGQGFAGGSVVYKHTLSNNGNVAVSSGPLSITNSDGTWTAVIYLDSDGDGQIDPGSSPITDISQIPGGLPVGGQKALLVKVTIPSGAQDNASNVTTVTVAAPGDTNPANDKAKDTTTVQPGNVSIVKKQALDAACDGTADAAFTTTQLSAKPGQCLVYELTLTNLGTQSITNTVISDTTPSFTTYIGTATLGPVAGTLSEPTAGTAGTVKGTVANPIASGTSEVLKFSVKVDE